MCKDKIPTLSSVEVDLNLSPFNFYFTAQQKQAILDAANYLSVTGSEYSPSLVIRDGLALSGTLTLRDTSEGLKQPTAEAIVHRILISIPPFHEEPQIGYGKVLSIFGNDSIRILLENTFFCHEEFPGKIGEAVNMSAPLNPGKYFVDIARPSQLLP